MWRFLRLCPIYLLIASLPLFSSIGQNLEYEYNLFVGILALTLIPLSAFFNSLYKLPSHSFAAARPIATLGWILVLSPVVGLIPGMILFVTDTCACSRNGFLFWYAIQVYPAWIIAHGIYFYILRLKTLGWTSVRVFGALVGTYLLLLVAAALVFWFHPQVRIVHPLLGFLHGPIYDAWIPVDTGIVLARLAHLTLGLVIVSLAFFSPYRSTSRLTIAGVMALWLGLTFVSAQYDSVGTGLSRLNRLLPATLATQDFALHYRGDSDLQTSPLPDEIQQLFDEARFHIAELKPLFGDDAPFVHIFVYPSRLDKKLWFGGGSTDVADVQTPSVHITAQRSPHPTLRHELVHALASKIAFHGLGFHPNMAFTEGLAIALAPEADPIGLHNGAAALIASNKITDIDALFSPLFWRESGARAYTVAGSIIKFLISEYGFEPVKRLYSGEDWDAVFGADKTNVLSTWRDFIFSDFDREHHALYAEALYRHPGVLRSVCAHTKADYRQDPNSSVWVRLRQPSGFAPDRNYWSWRIALDPKDRFAKVQLWRESISKIMRPEQNPDNETIQQWIDIVEKARHWPPKSLEDVDLTLLSSDINRQLGRIERSRALLRDLERYAQEKDIGDANLRSVQARLALDSVLPADGARPWHKYLAGWSSKIPASGDSDPWIVTYLRLRRGTKEFRDPDALQGWVDSSPAPYFADTFYVEWYRLLGDHAMAAGAYQVAEEAYTKATNIAPSAQVDFYTLNARRAAFSRQ